MAPFCRYFFEDNMISIQREQLLSPLRRAMGPATRATTLPILSHALIRSTGERLSITCTDLETQMEAITEIGLEPFEACIPAKRLSDILGLLPEQCIIDLDIKGGERLTLKAGRSRHQIAALPADQFPHFDRTAPACRFTIESKTLKHILDKIAFCIAVDDVRYYLKGALLTPSASALTAVSSDGHRFAYCEGRLDDMSGDPRDVIVPRDAVLLLCKQLPDSADPVQIELHESTLSVTLPGLVASVKQIEGRFPDWNRAISKDFPTAVPLDCGVAGAAFRRAALVKADKIKAVKVSLAGTELLIAATNENGEVSEDGFAIEAAEEMEFGINATYVTEALSHMDGQTALLNLTHNQTKLTDPNDPSYWYVVMPMRL